MSTNILGIIPARFASTRFPAKVLANIKGKTMIRRVYEQALQARCLSKVVVATDHPDVFKEVESFGGEAIMTDSAHQSGTDRCYEALCKTGGNYDFVINIQGDEPFIQPQQIDLLGDCLSAEAELATLAIRIGDPERLFDPNVVKVIFNTSNEAIYFSRYALPYQRNEVREEWLARHEYYKHIGIYAYRSDILEKITRLAPSALEKCESLEQLRWIENGYTIKIAVTTFDSYGIDTPEDLQRITRL